MLKHALKPAQTCAVPSAARTLPLVGSAVPQRRVRCNFQGSEEERTRRVADPYSTRNTAGNTPGYYSGNYNEDYADGLRDYFNDLKRKWDNWDPEERNQTLLYGSGALVALYIPNAVVDAIERVPLIPGGLKLVGLLYSSWFFYRYLLFADGRSDLSRDVTLENLFGKVNDKVDDLSSQAKGAMDRAKRSSASSSSSSRTSRGTAAYGASELDQSVKSAIHDLDKLAEDVRD